MQKVIGDFMQPKHIFKAKKAETFKVSAKATELLNDDKPAEVLDPTPEPEKPKRQYNRKPKQEDGGHAGPSAEG